MKKLYTSALIIMIIAAGLLGCKKIIKKIFQGIDADVPAVDVVLPPIPYAPPNELFFGTFTQQFDLDSTIRANTGDVYGANDIYSIKVKQIVFEVKNADEDNNISNFESARLAFSSNTNADTVTIATITFPETYAASYTYTPVNSAELIPYLRGSVLYYHAFGKLRKITTKPLPMSVKVTLRIQ